MSRLHPSGRRACRWRRRVTRRQSALQKFGVPVVPHVGDMGQLHPHLVLFNHLAVAHDVVFLEPIPHLRAYFVFPCRITAGVYQTPLEPGASCDLKSP